MKEFHGKNEVVKETILFILESTLFTFSIFGSWVMEQSLGINIVIEISVQICIIAFYVIRLWDSEELSERPFKPATFIMALLPVLLIFALNGFKIKKGFTWTVIPICIVTATCEEMHFRVNGCHLFREDGILGYSECLVLVMVFSVCRVFSFIVEGISISVMSLMEACAAGVLLLGYYLKTGNTKSLILVHSLMLIAEHLEFESTIPKIEIVEVAVSLIIGLAFIKTSYSKNQNFESKLKVKPSSKV